MDKKEEIRTDDLFVGLALPPTLFGAPFGYTIAVMILVGSLFISTNNPALLLIGFPLMFLGRLLIQKDPYAPEIWYQYGIMRTKLRRSAPNWADGKMLVVSVSPNDYHQGRKRKQKGSAERL